jgi:allantoinase
VELRCWPAPWRDCPPDWHETIVASFDLLVSGGRDAGGDRLDVAIADGVIAEVATELDPAAGAQRIDADGWLLLPGGVDPHVHFNEPGRTEWEGWATGTAALAAGGLTACLEMPLNAYPPTTSAAAFDLKLAVARERARIDFGLWGGVVPGNQAYLPELAARGVIGFKAFMSASGTEDFPASDAQTLHDAMTVIAALPQARLLAVHAESDALTARLAKAARAAGTVAVRDYLDSRPIAAETEAIAEAIGLAEQTGCPLHIAHVSSGAGVALVAAARARGLDVSCEVTTHHLLLTDEDAERLGAIAKCAPPLRPAPECDALWRALAGGAATFAVSDHSPCPPQMKSGDAFTAWGGIAGGQSTLELVVSEAGRRIPATELVRALCGGAAARFRLPGKGTLAVGGDGDLALVQTGAMRQLTRAELRDRHGLSPYVGRTLAARVRATVLRGRVIHRDGEPVGSAAGRPLTPA